MRNFIAVALLSLLPFSAFAVESQGSIELKTDSLYRGELITSDDLAASATLRFSGLFVDGLYVEGSTDTLRAEDLNDISLRARGAVGFVGSLWGLKVDASVARVYNPVLQSDDYNEVSLEVQSDVGLAGHFDLFGHVSHAFDGVDQWYAGFGVVGRDLLIEGLSAKAGVNFYHYDRSLTLDDWTRNNVETSLTYRLFDTVDAFALWSIGHKGVVGQELDNEYVLGVRVNF